MTIVYNEGMTETTKEQMMEAIHVGAAIKSGATLVHGTMMMNKVNKLDG